MFTIQEFIKDKNYNIDFLYIDKFWESIINDKWIYIDDDMLKWMGYSDNDIKKGKLSYIKMLENNFDKNNFKLLNCNEFKIFSKSFMKDLENIEINDHNKVKHLILYPKTFKKSLMLLRTSKANIIRDYYIELEDIFKDYLKYQNEYQKLLYEEEKISYEEKIKLLENKTMNNEFIKKICFNNINLELNDTFYIIVNKILLNENVFKLGITKNMKDRIGGYNIAQLKDNEYYCIFSVKCHNGKAFEKYIFSKLQNFKYKENNELYQIHLEPLKEIILEASKQEHILCNKINNILENYSTNYELLKPIILEQEIENYILNNEDININNKEEEIKINKNINKQKRYNIENTNDANNILKEYNIKLIGEYRDRTDQKYKFQCLSEFKHEFSCNLSYLLSRDKNNGCSDCSKYGILNTVKWYCYSADTYKLIKFYNNFKELKDDNPNIVHKDIKNRLRENRMETSVNGMIFTIFSPDNDKKFNINKELTIIEKNIIDTINLNFSEVKKKINKKLNSQEYYAIDEIHKIIYKASTFTKFEDLKPINNKKSISRKQVGKLLNDNNSKIENYGFIWSKHIDEIYNDYKLINLHLY